MTANAIKRGYIGSAEAAAYCGISIHTLRDWRKRGWVSYYKRGRDCLYTIEDIDACMRRCRMAARAELEIAEFERKAVLV